MPKKHGNDAERREETPEKAAAEKTAADDKPKRTRNNPRQRSRKHALNPAAIAEQERLQAEAEQSQGAEDTVQAASPAEAHDVPTTSQAEGATQASQASTETAENIGNSESTSR